MAESIYDVQYLVKAGVSHGIGITYPDESTLNCSFRAPTDFHAIDRALLFGLSSLDGKILHEGKGSFAFERFRKKDSLGIKEDLNLFRVLAGYIVDNTNVEQDRDFNLEKIKSSLKDFYVINSMDKLNGLIGLFSTKKIGDVNINDTSDARVLRGYFGEGYKTFYERYGKEIDSFIVKEQETEVLV